MLTRQDLREEIARVFGFREGTVVTGGSHTQFTDSGLLNYATDYWNGCQVMIITTDGGAPNGESREVTDFASTGAITASPAFSSLVDAGDTYQFYQNVTPDEINLAVNRSCRGMEVATSLTPSTSQYDYQLTVATGLQRRQQMTGVWLRQSNLLTAMPTEITNYQFEDAEGLLTIRIPMLLTSSDHLWITYLLDENSITSDTEAVNLPSELIKARATVYLLEIVMGRQGTPGQDKWGSLLRYWSEKLTNERRNHQVLPNRVKQLDWAGRASRTGEDALGIADLYT